MWQLYNLNKDVSAIGIHKSLQLMYPNVSLKDLTTTRRIELYSFGLSVNMFSDFSMFMKKLSGQ